MSTTNINLPRFSVSPDARSITDNDGTAILNVNSGRFHSLVGAGSLAWRKVIGCPEGVTAATVVDDLLAHGEFANEPRHQTERAVEHLLRNLATLGILYQSDELLDRYDSATLSLGSRVLISVIR